MQLRGSRLKNKSYYNPSSLIWLEMMFYSILVDTIMSVSRVTKRQNVSKGVASPYFYKSHKQIPKKKLPLFNWTWSLCQKIFATNLKNAFKFNGYVSEICLTQNGLFLAKRSFIFFSVFKRVSSTFMETILKKNLLAFFCVTNIFSKL